MTRSETPGKPGRARLRGWQLAALVGAVGALAVAGCGSSGSSGSSGSTSSTTAPVSGGSSSAPGNATSGTVNWWASPINTSGKDVRQVLISDFEAKYPNIKVTLTSAPTDTDTNRATLATDISGGSATPDVFMGDVIWPAQFGAHQLAVPLSNYLPASYWAQFAPGLVRAPRTRARSTARRCSRTRASCTTARTCWPRSTWRCPRPGSSWSLRLSNAAEGRAGQVRVRLAGRLVRGPDLQLHGVPDRRGRHGDQQQPTPRPAWTPRPRSRRSRSCAR